MSIHDTNFLYLVIKGHKILKNIFKIVLIEAKEWIYGDGKNIFCFTTE